MMTDVIDHLAGIRPGSALDAVRARRPEARRQAQASHDALVAPEEPGEVTLEERRALAAYVCGLHGEAEIEAFYAEGLVAGLRAAIAEAVARSQGPGPFGHYPPGPLSVEDSEGPAWQPDAALAGRLGARLAAACAHLHMLVLHPRDAAPADLQRLLDAGWSATGIVTLSQIAAFLSFQIRTIRGLAVLRASLEASP